MSATAHAGAVARRRRERFALGCERVALGRERFARRRERFACCRPTGGTRGFTLLEVLIAMALLALTLGAAVGAVTGSADRVTRLEERTLGFWVANNALILLQVDTAPAEAGTRFGEESLDGRDFHWQADILTTPDPATYRVELTVHRDAAGRDAVASLTGFLPAPPPERPIPGP